MDLKFICGDAASGKTFYLQETMIRASLEAPEKHMIYIVPEQSTLMVQADFLEQHPRHSMMNVEILSFQRLAHRILQETGEPAYHLLDDMGKSMLLYKAAVDHEKELSYYGASIHKAGFTGQMKIMLTELYQYRIDEAVLQRMCEALPEDSTLRSKLSDIRLLYQAFSERLSRDTIPSEKLLDVLTRCIPASGLLKGADLYIDGFYGFTPQQLEVLKALFAAADHVFITLTIPRMQMEGLLKTGHVNAPLYEKSARTFLQLKDLGVNGRIHFVEYEKSETALDFLREGLFSTERKEKREPEGIRILKADRPETEVSWTFSRIAELIHEKGYYYREIGILCADPEKYGGIIKRVADSAGIPVYMDETVDLSENPAVRMLSACLNMVRYGFSYDTVFDFVKTGFLPFEAEQLDQFENQALKEGWRGRKRFEEAFLELSGEDEDLTAWTKELFTIFGLMEGKHPVREQNAHLRRLIQCGDLERQLEKRAKWFADQGDHTQENLYGQIYEAILQILDQMDQVLGDEQADLKTYREILNVGFSQCRLGTLPRGADVITVMDPERSRSESLKALFVIGFREDLFPGSGSDTGLLSDAERRRTLAMHDMASDSRRRMNEQEFSFYTLLSKVRDSIWFSYSVSDGLGRSTRPSRYVSRIRELFEAEHLYDEEPAERWNPEQLRDGYYRGVFDGPKLQAVEQWLKDHGYKEDIRSRARAQADEAPEEVLDRGELWELLDMSGVSVSVSQLEQYARCPFAYYLRYGLKVKEREKLDIRPLDDGNVLHEIMEQMGPYLKGPVDAELAEQQVREIMASREDAYGQYRASKRFEFFWDRLRRSAVKSVLTLQEQLARGQFRPEAFEWTFGEAFDRIPPLRILLSDGREIALKGKIDRIDILDREQEQCFRIVDYKSGATSWNLSDVYEGLKLQLPVYMDAYRNASGGRPVGMFYFQLIPALVEKPGSTDEQELKNLRLRQARLDGVMLQDREILEATEQDPRDGLVTRTRLKKDGTFDQNEHTVTQAQMEALLDFAKRKSGKLAESILEGQVSPDPIMKQNGIACEKCEFQAACRLDPERDQQRVRRPSELDSEALWEKMSEQEE